jgi:hypothetical protein
VIRQGRDVGAFFLDESACAVTTAQPFGQLARVAVGANG